VGVAVGFFILQSMQCWWGVASLEIAWRWMVGLPAAPGGRRLSAFTASVLNATLTSHELQNMLSSLLLLDGGAACSTRWGAVKACVLLM
jgi:hypothetical protein